MAKYKYVHGDVSDSVLEKSLSDFINVGKDVPPEILISVLVTTIAGLTGTKQEAVNIFDAITKGLTRG